MENVPDDLKQALDERNRCREALKKTKAEIEEAKRQLIEVRTELSSSEAMALDSDEKAFVKKRNEVRTRFTESRDKLEFLEARLVGLEKTAADAEAKIHAEFPKFSAKYNAFVTARVQEFRDRYVQAFEQHIRPLMAEGWALADVLSPYTESLKWSLNLTKILDPVSSTVEILKFQSTEWDPKHKARVHVPEWKGTPEGEAAYQRHKEAADAFMAIERIYQRIDKDRREAEVQRKYHELAGKAAPAA